MLPASELRAGVAIRFEGALYKVLAAEYHAGQGKMTGAMHSRLLNLDTGTLRERRFRGDEPVDLIETERRTMQFLYADADMGYFMDASTYEQVAIERPRLGKAASFLKEDLAVPVEFIDGRPVGIVFPDIVEVRVSDTAPPIHAQGNESVRKQATLENGVTLLVPPFIAPGEWIRVLVEDGSYVERAKTDKKK